MQYEYCCPCPLCAPSSREFAPEGVTGMHNSFCPRALVIGCWLSGFCMGLLAAMEADAVCFSLMRLSMLCRVSIVWLLLRCLFPFLVAAFAVMIHKRNIVPVLVFLHCFGFGYFLWMSLGAFGSGAWLAVPLLRLPDTVSFVLLCWLCLQGDGGSRRGFWVCIILIIAAVIVDDQLISPLRVMLHS